MEEQAAAMADDSMPPLMATYGHLLDESSSGDHQTRRRLELEDNNNADDAAQCDLPAIDLAGLLREGEEDECRAAIVRAASEWGFFMVTNHGVERLNELHEAQVAVFRRPFQVKVSEPLPDFSPESYRWGTPTAACLDQLSWSEAYHIPLTTTITTPTASADDDRTRRTSSRRQVIQDVSIAMWQLAQRLLRILTLQLQGDDDMVTMNRDTCFLRLNRYPPCPSASVFGLCPHTDSDFLTILHQDAAVGGLQLRLNSSGRWVAVRPRPGALIVNVGDLLQAWSNDLYRSVEHRVMANPAQERFSVAFFLCPSYDTTVRPRCPPPPRYRSFTFRDYRNQVTEDVRITGRKLGLQTFRLPSSSSS